MTPSERLDLAWKYFDLHAKQRISLFNFFVLFSGLLTTGYVASVKESHVPLWLPLTIGVLQVLTSYVFYALDERNKNLTRHAEEAIKEIESSTSISASEPRARIFTSEADMTLSLPGPVPRTIGGAFRWLFLTFILFGGVEVTLALYLMHRSH